MSKLITNTKTLGSVEGISCENATVEKVTVIKDITGDIYVAKNFVRNKLSITSFDELDETTVTIKTDSIVSYKTVTAVKYSGNNCDIIVVFNSNCIVNFNGGLRAGLDDILSRDDVIKIFYFKK